MGSPDAAGNENFPGRLASDRTPTILLVEQNARMALSIADKAYVIETGEIVLEGSARDLMQSEEVKKAYLGG